MAREILLAISGAGSHLSERDSSKSKPLVLINSFVEGTVSPRYILSQNGETARSEVNGQTLFADIFRIHVVGCCHIKPGVGRLGKKRLIAFQQLLTDILIHLGAV